MYLLSYNKFVELVLCDFHCDGIVSFKNFTVRRTLSKQLEGRTILLKSETSQWPIPLKEEERKEKGVHYQWYLKFR
jgi:hypothetical protein